MVASTAPALAQGEEVSGDEGEAAAPADDTAGEATAPADDTAGGEATAPEGSEPAAPGLGRWPRGAIDRPLTLPKGLALAGADVIGYKGGEDGDLLFSGDVAVGYGITNDLEINTVTPTYAFALKEFEIKGSLDLGVGYKILRGAAGGKLEVIARAVAGYDLLGEAARPIRVGVQAQYNVTPKFAVVSHDIGSGNLGVSIAVDGEVKPIFATLPIGVGVQPTPELWVEVDTALIPVLEISDAESVFISDVTPVAVTAIYNLLGGHLDAIGYFGFSDVQNAGDTINFGVGARYYVGAVD